MLVLQLALPASAFAAIEPTLTAESAIVYCENTGEVVYTKDEEKKLDPYSTTKLMTALVTVMNTPLDRKVKISEKAASQGGTTAGFKAGETVSVEQLLYGLLVQSGNDAAYALAEAVAGDQEEFVRMMNRTAGNIGCSNTKFATAAGYKNSGNYTTAEDMMMITKVVMDNETIRTVAGTEQYLMKPTDMSGVRSFSSDTFKIDDSVYAGKIGYWENDAAVVAGCDVNGLNLYIVALGDTRDAYITDVKALIKYSQDKIEGVLAVKGDKKVGSVHVKRGEITKLDVYTAYDGYAYIPSEGSKSLIKTKISIDENVKAPLKSGDQVGTFRISVGSELVNEIPLIVKEDVKEGWPTSYLGISNRTALIMGIVLGVLVFFMIIVTVIRIVHKIRKRRERKRKIMEMAREEMLQEEDRKKRGWDV